MDLIKTITDWPVIIQGALGSALFWAIIEFGQRVARRTADRLSKDKVTANWFALAAHEAPPPMVEHARFICLYGSLHYMLKALVTIAVSFAINPILDVFASVGYLISVYFLFRALAFVPHTASFGPIADRKKRFLASVASVLKEGRGPDELTKSAPPKDGT